MGKNRIPMSKNPFREAVLEKKEFTYTLELVPGRGARGKTQDQILGLAEKTIQAKLIHAVSITDNPGGHPALSPDVIGLEICRMGINPIIHFTCKDKNRNQMESILYALDRIGIHNLLVMTGDFPLYGFEGKAKPVYDLDSVQLIHLVTQMNQGICIEEKAPGGGMECPPTHFFKGCAVSPFKKLESEVMAQYYKLTKKAKMGADFIITQVGFDARKFDELLRFMRQSGFRLPVLGNVYILNKPVARVMNRGGVPGCVVTDDLYRIIERESASPDKGRAARLTQATKLIAVLKGIGYDGVHIGGPNLSFEDLQWVIEQSKEFSKNWKEWVREFSFPQKDGFYLFQKDEKTGLNSDVPNFMRSHPSKSLGYAIMRLFHHWFFVPEAPFHRKTRWLCEKIDGSRFEGAFTEVEYWMKFFTSRCRRCGDCTLPEVAFLCPQSQCPKFLFNGQCGGSSEGWCEVFPGKRRCIYVRAYDRLKPYREEESLKQDCIPPRNWALDQISSWANYFLGRDHHAKK
jgi:methylenetetrahydrofolate reductase (NADPH)